MPYLAEKIPIAGTEHDARIKLTLTDKARIREFHAGGESIRSLARGFGVSRRLIQFVLFPERKVQDLANRAARGGWKQYYDKDQWREDQKKHRRRKHALRMDGKISLTDVELNTQAI